MYKVIVIIRSYFDFVIFFLNYSSTTFKDVKLNLGKNFVELDNYDVI